MTQKNSSHDDLSDLSLSLDSDALTLDVGDTLEISGGGSLSFDESGMPILSFDEEDSNTDDLMLGESQGLTLEPEADLLTVNLDIVETCRTYYNSLSTTITELKTRMDKSNKQSVTSIWAPTQFEFVPPVAKQVMCEAIDNLAAYRGNSMYTMTEADEVDYILAQVYEFAKWSPRAYTSVLKENLLSLLQEYWKLLDTKAVDNTFSAVKLLRSDEMEADAFILYLNYRPFQLVTDVFSSNSGIAPSTTIERSKLTPQIKEILAGQNLRTVDVNALMTVFYDIASEPERLQDYNMVLSDFVSFVAGEQFRRAMVYDIEHGLIDLEKAASIQEHSKELDVCIPLFLNFVAAQTESSAMTMLSIVLILLSIRGNDYADFVMCMVVYLASAHRRLSDVRLVVYNRVVGGEEKKYRLQFGYSNTVYSSESDDLLFTVCGDIGHYVIPRILHDDESEFSLLPLPQLYMQLKATSNLVSRGKWPKNSAYVFEPRGAYLKECNLLVDGTTDGVDDTVRPTDISNNELLHTLRQVSHEFEDDLGDSYASVIEAGGKTFYGYVGEDDTTVKLVSVASGSGMEVLDSGAAIAEDGVLVINYKHKKAGVVTETYKEGEFEEVHFAVKEEAQASDLNYTDYVMVEEAGTALTPPAFESAVRNLCELCAVDFYEEVEAAQRLACSAYYNLLDIHYIHGMIGGRILELYQDILEDQSGSMDSVNYDMLVEVAGFSCDATEFSEHKTWWEGGNEELKRVIGESKKVISSIAGHWSNLEKYKDLLASQAVSHSILHSSENFSIYMAMHMIPALHAWLYNLELRMVAIRLLSVYGDVATNLYINNKALRMFSQGDWKEKFNLLPTLDKFNTADKRQRMEFFSSLAKASGEQAIGSIYAVLKTAILERDIYAIYNSFKLSQEKSPDFLDKYVQELELEDEGDESLFRVRVLKKGTDALFREHRDYWVDLLLRLIKTELCDVHLDSVGHYDAFMCFYPLLFGKTVGFAGSVSETGEQQITGYNDFYNFAMSLIVSYCPVTGDSAPLVDSGESRAILFFKSPADFTVPASMYANCDKFTISDLKCVVAFDLGV